MTCCYADSMRFISYSFFVLFAGCGGMVAPPELVADSGTASDTSPVGFADAGGLIASDSSGGGPIATDAAPVTVVDASKPAETFSVTRLRVCGSSASVDKAIIDTSEPVAPVADATKFIRISYAGASSLLCPEVWDAKSSTGEYAFGARCSRIDRTKAVEFVISDGISSVTGKALKGGILTFVPGGSGPECAEFKP